MEEKLTSKKSKMSFEVAEDQGNRCAMEDRHIYETDKNGNVLICVFDGHSGFTAAEFLQENFGSIVWNALKATNFTSELHKNFEVLKETFKSKNINSGSTIVGVLILTTGIVYGFHVGDSQYMILNESTNEIKTISPIHDFTNPEELKAVLSRTYNEGRNKCYVYADRVCGNINMSRTFGDYDLFSADCYGRDLEVHSFQLEPNCSYKFIVACDGLFDEISAPKVANRILHENWTLQKMKDVVKNGRVGDNVTIIQYVMKTSL